MTEPKQTQKATFAAGCFWGIEYRFSCLQGVLETVVGYSGGTFPNPSYEDVCANKTGHAESVQILFDPEKISYEQLLDIFWKIHDPTTKNRQGMDFGTQYRSIIFYHTEKQKREAERSIQELQKSKKFKNPLVTEIIPAETFYKAEEYHQQYYKKQGWSCKIEQ